MKRKLDKPRAGYLYEVHREDVVEIMIVTSCDDKKFKGRTLAVLEGNTSTMIWDAKIDVVSTDYEQNLFRFYEIGPKEDYPEYFI